MPLIVSSFEVELQDELINLDEITEIANATNFLVTRGLSRSFEQNDITQMDLVFVRDLDYKKINRSQYSILDIISDVGGLLGILMGAVSVFIFIWNYNSLDNYMVSKLFKSVQVETVLP